MAHTQTTSPNLCAGKKKGGVRPAEVGALTTPVFEKSATELKLKQKLLRICQLPELTASAIDHNIDTLCIQEHIYLHSEDIIYHDTGN